ncbi:MAG: hypothetical protein WCH85_11275 [Methanomicrobiales archaeon]
MHSIRIVPTTLHEIVSDADGEGCALKRLCAHVSDRKIQRNNCDPAIVTST